MKIYEALKIVQNNPVDFSREAKNKWESLLKQSAFDEKDLALCTQSKNLQKIKKILLILTLITSLAFLVFLFLMIFFPSGTFSLIFFILLIATALSIVFCILTWTRSKKAFADSQECLSKIKKVITDEWFHNEMFARTPFSEHTNISKIHVKKFKNYLFNQNEINSDCFIPAFLNNRNVLFKSTHATLWTKKAYSTTRTWTVNGHTSSRVITIYWPFPEDWQYTSILDTTNMAPNLEYITAGVKLGSEKSIEKFNAKHQQVPLENQEFNKLFPATRSDEQQYRVLFDLSTQENLVDSIKKFGPITSFKSNEIIDLSKIDKSERTFCPSQKINAHTFINGLEKSFLFYYNKILSDFISLNACYLSFSCFPLEREKKVSNTFEEITDFEIEETLYSLPPFENVLPKTGKPSEIKHFSFSRNMNIKKNLVDLNVDSIYYFFVKKPVYSQGATIYVDDYQKNQVCQRVLMIKYPSTKNSIEEFKTLETKLNESKVCSETKYDLNFYKNLTVIRLLRGSDASKIIPNILKLI